MFSSSGSGKKAPQQQEMVQVDRSESASPFWNPPKRGDASKKPTRDPNMVVGAAYSHADMLKFDSLNLSSSSSRPKTPPSSQSAKARTSDVSSSSRPTPGLSSPPFRTYMNFLSNTNDDWKADEEDEMMGYDDDDGDDFGLPSLSNTKRRTRKMAAQKTDGNGTLLSPALEGSFGGIDGRRLSNSGDIAIERPAPAYPMPKKSEGKILRPQYKDILKDPANALHLINHPPTAANATPKEIDAANSRITRINKFKKILQASTIPIAELRQLAWSGVPEEVRAMTWQLLLSYLPANSERRVATLERKRKEYLDGVRQAFERGGANPSTAGKARGLDEAIWHQISIDVPRTNPHIELYSYEATQRSLERILYLWAVRHPASGYVQGINDLVSPFWQVFLGIYIGDPNVESGMDPGQLPKPVLDAVEADSFWCLTKLLDGIQDHYIVAQPGIQRQVAALRDLTARIDGSLVKHLEKENVEFIQFSFRWMNCLLMREISVKNTIRMWDTYLAEEQGFSEFHLYVCAAFLVKWSDKLVKMDFQEIMMFLQSLPTKSWTEKDIELLLSEAFIWQSLFKGSSAHLRARHSTEPESQLRSDLPTLRLTITLHKTKPPTSHTFLPSFIKKVRVSLLIHLHRYRISQNTTLTTINNVIMADAPEKQQEQQPPVPAEEAPLVLPPINEAVAAIIDEAKTGASTPSSIGAQSDHDILSKKVTLADLTAKATAMYARKEYDEAAEVFAAAAELQADINGEENQPDNAEILFLYGRTLFKVGQTKSDVLGGQAASKKVEKPQPKTPRAPKEAPAEAAAAEDAKTTEQKVTQEGLAVVAEQTDGAKKAETVDNKKPLFQFEGDENFEDSDDEVAEGEGEEDGEEEVDDLQAAFDILEMARISLEKKLEQVKQQESEDPTKGKEVSEGDSGILRHVKERLADTHDLLAEISLENERFPAAVRDSRISLQFKKELYPQESEVIAEAHFKLSLALEFASATTTQEDGAAEGEQAPFDEKLREEAITELEAAIQSTKLKLQAKEVELAEMANPEENVATKAQISDVRDIIDDMEQRLTEMRKPQVDFKAALEAAAGTAIQGIMGSALGESASETQARVEEAKKNATDLTGLVRKKKKDDDAQPAEQTNGSGSNGTKRKAEEPAESDESAKKAKVVEEAI